MAEQSVTLQPGESKLVSFEATPHEARSYQVSVNGLAGSFVATAPVAEFVYASKVRHYTQRVSCDPPWSGGTDYIIFEVDVQNQGNIAQECLVSAYLRYRGWMSRDPWGAWRECKRCWEGYAREHASEHVVDRATIAPGEIVTFRNLVWRWYALPWGEYHYKQVKFVGDPGEILSVQVPVG
ncbi:hypothetical protein ES705_35450 [subsurface metagenome]